MGNPKTLGSYVQHINFLDQSQDEPKGIKLVFADNSKAARFRHMCYSARRLYHEQTNDFSKWADIVITLDKDTHTLTIGRQSIDILNITDFDGNPLRQRPSETLRELDEAREMEAQAHEYSKRPAPVMYPDHDKLGVQRTTRGGHKALPDIEIVLPEDFKPLEPFKLGDLE